MNDSIANALIVAFFLCTVIVPAVAVMLKLAFEIHEFCKARADEMKWSKEQETMRNMITHVIDLLEVPEHVAMRGVMQKVTAEDIKAKIIISADDGTDSVQLDIIATGMTVTAMPHVMLLTLKLLVHEHLKTWNRAHKLKDVIVPADLDQWTKDIEEAKQC